MKVQREGLTFSSRPVIQAPAHGRGKGDIRCATIEADVVSANHSSKLSINPSVVTKRGAVKGGSANQQERSTPVKKEQSLSRAKFDPHQSSNPFGTSKQGRT